MLKAWSDWWAGEQFQRQSTGNQRQNAKRDVSHRLCESIRGAKGVVAQASVACDKAGKKLCFCS